MFVATAGRNSGLRKKKNNYLFQSSSAYWFTVLSLLLSDWRQVSKYVSVSNFYLTLEEWIFTPISWTSNSPKKVFLSFSQLPLLGHGKGYGYLVQYFQWNTSLVEMRWEIKLNNLHIVWAQRQTVPNPATLCCLLLCYVCAWCSPWSDNSHISVVHILRKKDSHNTCVCSYFP